MRKDECPQCEDLSVNECADCGQDRCSNYNCSFVCECCHAEPDDDFSVSDHDTPEIW